MDFLYNYGRYKFVRRDKDLLLLTVKQFNFLYYAISFCDKVREGYRYISIHS